jgi:hypothetical protein
MTGTITLSGDQTAEHPSSLYVSFDATAYASGPSVSRRVPLFVPRDQAYFWTSEWQQGEAEALREIAEGKGLRFSSGTTAVEWLLADEE